MRYDWVVAKRHKHHKKQRPQRAPKPSTKPAASAAPAVDETKPHQPEQTHATSINAPQNIKPTGVTATFTRADHGPRGIDSKVAELEYASVRRDLRKLGVTIVVFTAIIAGLTVLGSQTSAITDLGSYLFTWWK